jgi:hypothetical protein
MQTAGNKQQHACSVSAQNHCYGANLDIAIAEWYLQHKIVVKSLNSTTNALHMSPTGHHLPAHTSSLCAAYAGLAHLCKPTVGYSCCGRTLRNAVFSRVPFFLQQQPRQHKHNPLCTRHMRSEASTLQHYPMQDAATVPAHHPTYSGLLQLPTCNIQAVCCVTVSRHA